MASVALVIPDLLFTSKISESMVAAGHEVALFSDGERFLERLPELELDLLVVDFLSSSDIGGGLASKRLDPLQFMEQLRAAGLPTKVKTVASYAHVDVATRRNAEQAGFDRIFPRSRIARDPAALIGELL